MVIPMSDVSALEGRPPIPTEIRRRVLVEAGHRCAIPTCRYIEVDVHHIVPWAQCQVHNYDNLIALCPNCHRRADRGEIDRKSLRLYKLNLRFIHDKYSQLEMDILFELAALPDGQGIHWPPFNQILLKRILESGYVLIHESNSGITMSGMRVSPDIIGLTPKGRAFIADLGLTEL
jgi:hypothetical protein